MLNYFHKIGVTKCVRSISSSSVLNGRTVTKESGVRPGSSEVKEPLKWAKRIFDQQHLKQISYDTPNMLNLVFLKSRRSIPYYCKAILQKYDLLTHKLFKYQIVKNIPSVNEDLIKVANWIKVVPIKFPHGIPKTTQDFLNAQLRPDGNFILHTGNVIDGAIIDADQSLREDSDRMAKVKALIFDSNKHTERALLARHFKSDNMLDWRKNRFLSGYFTAHYQYKHNQDGKEYRYSNLHRFHDSLKQSMARRFNEDGTVRMNLTFEADWNTYPWRIY